MSETIWDGSFKKVALITGISGQDGGFLASLLLEKGYEVHGVIRRSSSMCNRKWIDGLDVELHYGDLTDSNAVRNIIIDVDPDEIYNLGAQSHVGISFENPDYTFRVNCLGTLNILETIKEHNRNIHMYHASTSEMLAKPERTPGFSGNLPSNENTSFDVHSPYAISKLAAHHLCQIYHKSYGMFVCCGILYNHESSRRGDNFVTQKIVKALVNKQDIELGNIESMRDWGYAKEYVEAMWLILQQPTPDDYVIATGESHSVKEFIEECCRQLYLTPKFKDNKIIIYKSELLIIKDVVCIITLSNTQKRPWDVDYLCGDASKAERVLGWKAKIKMKELIEIMIEAEQK